MAAGFDLGSVVAHIKADVSDFKSGINEAKKQADGFAGNLKSAADGIATVGRQSAILAGVVGGALVLGVKSSIDAFKEAELAAAQQAAALKSTHGASGLFIEDLQDQAKALQKMTMYSDEAVGGAQNLLLTFTSIKGPIFQQATDTVLDMSQALGQDLKSSSIQLGKALNDPIQGVTALRRVGVSFNEQQLDQIKTMQESGNIMGAQKLILAELSKEFGGSAKAAGETFAGKLTILKNMFGELQETVGKVIIDGLTPLVGALTAIATNEDVINWVRRFAEAFQTFGEMVSGKNMVAELSEGLGLDPNSPIIQGIQMFADGLNALGKWIGANKDLVLTFLTGLGVALGVLLIIGTITALVMAFTNPLVLVALAIAALYTAWQTNFLGIQDIMNTVFTFLSTIVTGVVMPIIATLTDWIRAHWTEISLVTSGIWNIVVGLLQWAMGIILAIVSVAMALITGNWKQAHDNIMKASQMVYDGVVKIFTGIGQALLGIGAYILDALTAPFKDAWNQISNLMNKIKDAIDFTKRHSPSVVDIVNRGVGQVNKALGNLDIDLGATAPQIAGSFSPVGGGGGSINSITIDLGGAIISDEASASRMAEKIGDLILDKVKKSQRM